MKNFKERVIIALDYSDLNLAGQLLEKLKGEAYFYKIGSELFTSCGMQGIELVRNYGCKIFLDLKFHDIPNTVYNAVKSAGKLGVDIINVHASGGADMMRAAKKGGKEASNEAGKHIDIVAVTVLTNLSGKDVRQIFYNFEDDDNTLAVNKTDDKTGGNIASDLAIHLAKSAKISGLDGVVCSGHESLKIKNALGRDFKTITPGIRLRTGKIDDQKRIMTPSDAFGFGADYIVVGREITNSDSPADALRDIYSDIEKRL